MTLEEIHQHAKGIEDGEDAWYHREKLQTRLTALLEDEPIFGLVLAEQLEASVIQQILEKSD